MRLLCVGLFVVVSVVCCSCGVVVGVAVVGWGCLLRVGVCSLVSFVVLCWLLFVVACMLLLLIVACVAVLCDVCVCRMVAVVGFFFHTRSWYARVVAVCRR